MSPVRVSLEDRLLTILAEHGPLTTGRIRRLTGPHLQTSRVAHGRQTVTETQPTATRQQTRLGGLPQLPVRTRPRATGSARATPRVRNALRRLERSGQVSRVKSSVSNNYGGDLWICLDGGAPDLTRGVER